MSYLWNLVLYKPLLNALAFLVSILPGGSVGLAIILLTILVKILLFPLSQKALKNQAAQSLLAPEIEKIKKSGVSKEEQARLQLELFKKHKFNPLAGCLPLLATMFVFIALYNVFIKGVDFDPNMLYSFVHIPEQINIIFLGFLDLGHRSITLAIVAGISQYFQGYYMPQPKKKPFKLNEDMSFGDSFAQSMSIQMKYGFPIMIFVFSLFFSGAVALYWIVSNIFTIGQQIYVNKTEEKVLDKEVEMLKA